MKSKESVMSPTEAGRFSDAAALANHAGAALPTPECEDGTSQTDDGASGLTLSMAPWPTRPVSLARVGPSRNAHPRPYNDPSNYLG
jgi:hypothetical protein